MAFEKTSSQTAKQKVLLTTEFEVTGISVNANVQVKRTTIINKGLADEKEYSVEFEGQNISAGFTGDALAGITDYNLEEAVKLAIDQIKAKYE